MEETNLIQDIQDDDHQSEECHKEGDQEQGQDSNFDVTVMLKELQMNLKQTMVKKFIEHIHLMINELELSFDYISKDNLNKIRSNIKKENKLNQYVKECCERLKPYEERLTTLNTVKLKTKDYDFMKEIVLFDNLLNLGEFNDENKNTKKSILNYVYTIYIFSVFLNDDNNFTDRSDHILNELTKLSHTLQSSIDNEKNNEKNGTSVLSKSSKHKSKKHKHVKSIIDELGDLDLEDGESGMGGIGGMGGMGDLLSGLASGLPGGLGNLAGSLGGMGGMGGITSVMNDILKNKEIVDIAMQVSKDMQSKSVNPMNILSAFMSGDTSSISDLVNTVETTINSKIEKGEIDQNVLEEQSKRMLETIGQNKAASEIPGLNKINDLLEKM